MSRKEKESAKFKLGQSRISSVIPSSVPRYTQIRVPEEQKRAEITFEEIMAQNFPNVMKDINLHI